MSRSQARGAPADAVIRPGRAATVAAAALLAAGASAAASDRRVDVGGFRLHVRCAGVGSPTVVLDAGAGDTLATWKAVLPRVKAFARVCAYDRAGLGRSDPGPAPRTSGRIADELWSLLERGNIPGPYVLVGHSFGGLNVRVLASRHPAAIAGLVFVEATPVAYPAREATLLSPEEREKSRTALGMAPPAARDEMDGMMRSAEEVRRGGPVPEVPVIVVTAAHRDDAPAFRTAWLEMQRDLVAAFPSARQIIAEASGHYVPLDEPGVVAEAIRDVVEAARRDEPPGRARN